MKGLIIMEIAAIIIIAIALLWWWGGKLVEKDQAIIPKNVGKTSYIDESTGTIYLRSFDYHTNSGEEWIVSDSSITIKQNNSSKSQIIPFSKIHTLNLDRKELNSSLSFEILEKRNRLVVEGVFEDKMVPIAIIPIFFSNKDMNFAQAACDRIAEHSSK